MSPVSDATDGLPILPHQASEFYTWLWWRTVDEGGILDLPGKVGRVELWVDDRLAFRIPGESKVTAVMTGDQAGETLEARAALAGGKVLQELRLHLRRDDREFSFTLKGPAMDVARAKLPQQVGDGDEALYDRMFLYEELLFVVAALLREFAGIRTSDAWETEVVPAIRSWVVPGADRAG